MITWAIVNSILSLLDAAIIAYEVRCYFAYLTFIERLGKTMMGSALILTVAPILANRGAPYLSSHGTPFNMWPSFMLRLGIGVLFVGRIIRHYRHDRANREQVAMAKAHFEAKRT